jgi:hypothetical protein
VFPGALSNLLPDLVVRWSKTPATGIKGVRSDRYGEIHRRAAGVTGRNGSHTAEAFALVLPGASRERVPTRPARVRDLAPTVCATLGVNGAWPDAELLLEPAG